MTIAENISIEELRECWLKSKPFNYNSKNFAVLKIGGTINEYRLYRNGKESIVLQYPKTKLGFCVITELIKD